MKKYIIFGWSEEARNEDPADELLGTWHTKHEEDLDTDPDHPFVLKHIEEDVTLSPKLFQGKTFPMTVLATFDRDGGELRRRIVAYYEIPATKEGQDAKV